MNAERNHVTVSLELLDVSKLNLDCRHSITKSKGLKGSVFEDSENAPHLQMAKPAIDDCPKLEQGSVKPLDSVENIHNGAFSIDKSAEEPKLSKEESHETMHLKDLLLLHLDLIQQQQDLLVMKERVISQYKEENNTLRCRLERMERRVSLMKGGGLSPSKLDHVPKVQTLDSPKVDQQIKAIKRRSTLEPQSLAKKFANIARCEYEKDRARGRIKGRHSAPGRHFETTKPRRRIGFNRLSLTHRRPVKKISRRPNISNKVSTSDPQNESSSQVDSLNQDRESHWVSRSLRNRNLTSPPFVPYSPQKSQLIIEPEPAPEKQTPSKRTDSKQKAKVSYSTASSTRKKRAPIPKDSNILRSNVMYYVPDCNVEEPEIISPKKPEQEDVMVPTFRIKKFTPYYVIEGTENYDDEVFAKRHQKHELEEKKRKRWDLQRQRELEQFQKLQEKQNGKNDKDMDDEEFDTFKPDPDKIQFIEVSEGIAVNIFGAPIPKIDQDEFDVPWFDLDRRERQDARRSKLRRR